MLDEFLVTILYILFAKKYNHVGYLSAWARVPATGSLRCRQWSTNGRGRLCRNVGVSVW